MSPHEYIHGYTQQVVYIIVHNMHALKYCFSFVYGLMIIQDKKRLDKTKRKKLLATTSIYSSIIKKLCRSQTLVSQRNYSLAILAGSLAASFFSLCITRSGTWVQVPAFSNSSFFSLNNRGQAIAISCCNKKSISSSIFFSILTKHSGQLAVG